MRLSRRSTIAAAAAFAAIAVSGATVLLVKTDGNSSVAGEPAGEILREDFVVSSDPGIDIAVREIHPPDSARSSADFPPVLLVHGARVPGVASFDLDVPGGSVARDLATRGHAVYIMDARGYGASTRPASMDTAPGREASLVRSDAVVRDISAVVDSIVERTGPTTKVALVGWATGGHWAGHYAAANPDKVSHLVLYNTLYGPIDGHPTLGRGSNYEDPARPGQFNTAQFGSYRTNTAESLLPSWDRSIPSADKNQWRDPAVVDAYLEGALASDPTSNDRNPRSFRAPSGALEDSFYLATGRQLWDASLITASVLVLRSEFDFWSRPEDPQKLLEHLTNAESVRYAELADSTHYAHLDRQEKGRGQFMTELANFLVG